MNFDYVIVQAGGKGTRLQHLTRNKPKALVPVNNLPMCFHLFKKYPDKKFVIIGDYKYDVLKRYLAAFAQVDYVVVDARGRAGTCGGLNIALSNVPDNTPFMLIWSDLILNEDLDISKIPQGNYVGTSLGFECRWKYEHGEFEEECSSTCGVAGMFLFDNKNYLADVPESGEFVRWLSNMNIDFGTITLDRTKEYGLISEYNKLKSEKCRPFNRITIRDDILIKEGIDDQGKKLAKRETAWYQFVREKGITAIPQIYELNPLMMEKIDGKNIYEYPEIPVEDKKLILTRLIDCLAQLHKLGSVPFDAESYDDAYLGKTFDRLAKVRNLVPFANQEYVVINGKKCRNVFGREEELAKLFNEFRPDKFVFLHGDCTFSNMMLRNDCEPVLIDPRGYFGKTELYGDAAYDWAKLYYSIVGNYDQFNLKRFSLSINESDVSLEIESSQWEDLEDFFFANIPDNVTERQIKLIHAIIWLSLTTYAWENYDSICGAFYKGLLCLEDVL